MNNTWIERDENDSKIIIDEDNRCVKYVDKCNKKAVFKKASHTD